jgi:hypothetical protein
MRDGGMDGIESLSPAAPELLDGEPVLLGEIGRRLDVHEAPTGVILRASVSFMGRGCICQLASFEKTKDIRLLKTPFIVASGTAMSWPWDRTSDRPNCLTRAAQYCQICHTTVVNQLDVSQGQCNVRPRVFLHGISPRLGRRLLFPSRPTVLCPIAVDS